MRHHPSLLGISVKHLQICLESTLTVASRCRVLCEAFLGLLMLGIVNIAVYCVSHGLVIVLAAGALRQEKRGRARVTASRMPKRL